MMRKKGSLNLSIEAIVIVVIAFVVLGLGLGFVRQQFKDITRTTVTIQEQIRQQILEDLRTGNKKLSFPAETLTVEKGQAQDIAIGVKNVKASGDLTFKIQVGTIKRQGAPPETDVADQIQYFLSEESHTLKVTEADVYGIKITASGDKGTYLVSLKIIDQNAPAESGIYAEKSFFVNII